MKKPSLACSPVRCTKKAAGSWFTSLLTVGAILSALFGVQARGENSSSVLESDNPVKQRTLQSLREVAVTSTSKAERYGRRPQPSLSLRRKTLNERG